MVQPLLEQQKYTPRNHHARCLLAWWFCLPEFEIIIRLSCSGSCTLVHRKDLCKNLFPLFQGHSSSRHDCLQEGSIAIIVASNITSVGHIARCVNSVVGDNMWSSYKIEGHGRRAGERVLAWPGGLVIIHSECHRSYIYHRCCYLGKICSMRSNALLR